jgi:hypothetical protein
MRNPQYPPTPQNPYQPGGRYRPSENELETEIDRAIANLREKLAYEVPTGALGQLLGADGEPSLSEAAFPWPALMEIIETLITYKIPRDVNVPARIPLTSPQITVLRLMATMQLLGIHYELARGAWTNEDEKNRLTLERHNAYRVYRTLEDVTRTTSTNFSGH